MSVPPIDVCNEPVSFVIFQWTHTNIVRGWLNLQPGSTRDPCPAWLSREISLGCASRSVARACNWFCVKSEFRFSTLKNLLKLPSKWSLIFHSILCSYFSLSFSTGSLFFKSRLSIFHSKFVENPQVSRYLSLSIIISYTSFESKCIF